MLPKTTRETIVRTFEDALNNGFDEIEEVYDREAEVDVPFVLKLTSNGSGQIDVTVTGTLVVNAHDKPPPTKWQPQKKTFSGKITINKKQLTLPGLGDPSEKQDDDFHGPQ
jgi:hypothetical protein